MTTTPLIESPDPLAAVDPKHKIEPTAADRCDRPSCGAQGRARVVLPSGGTLLFCRHCVGGVDGAERAKKPAKDSDSVGLKNRRALTASGAIIIDF